jgi:hypothetical protein
LGAVAVTDFAIANLPGPVGSLQYAELFRPLTGGEGGGLVAAEMPLVESPAGNFGGRITIDPGAPDNLSVPYEYEVRQVPTADPAGFDASSTETVSRGTYGYLSGGVWYETEPLGTAVGFWTSQAAVQQVYGIDNTALDANLSDDGSGVAAVWQRALDNTDARMDLLVASYLKARPAAQSGTAYTFASRVAAAQVRYDLHKGRGQTESNPAGGPNAGGVHKREADDLWAELEGYLEEGVLDFPDVLDSSGAVQGTAPQILRPTMDAEGRPLAVAGTYDRPYWDGNSGWWRW